MDGPGGFVVCEIKKHRKRQILCYYLPGESKNKINGYNEIETDIDKENRLGAAIGEREERRGKIGVGD